MKLKESIRDIIVYEFLYFIISLWDILFCFKVRYTRNSKTPINRDEYIYSTTKFISRFSFTRFIIVIISIILIFLIYKQKV